MLTRRMWALCATLLVLLGTLCSITYWGFRSDHAPRKTVQSGDYYNLESFLCLATDEFSIEKVYYLPYQGFQSVPFAYYKVVMRQSTFANWNKESCFNRTSRDASYFLYGEAGFMTEFGEDTSNLDTIYAKHDGEALLGYFIVGHTTDHAVLYIYRYPLASD